MPGNPDEEKNEYERTLQQEIDELHAYRKSLEAEFSADISDDPEAAEKVRKKLYELVPDAGTTIRHLMIHAASESVRATLAKFVFTETMRTAKEVGADDEIDKLIKALKTPTAVE